MVARQALREAVAAAPAGRRVARRPGGTAALASAVGNRAFCALIARDDKTTRKPKATTPKLDYARAEKQNRSFAQQPSQTRSLGPRLGGEARRRRRRPRRALESRHANPFADAVAALQVKQGSKGKAVDGVLGPTTWSRLAGLGEGMASIPVVENTDDLCYMATQRRFEGGALRATGKRFSLPKGTSKKVFDTIIATHAGR